MVSVMNVSLKKLLLVCFLCIGLVFDLLILFLEIYLLDYVLTNVFSPSISFLILFLIVAVPSLSIFPYHFLKPGKSRFCDTFTNIFFFVQTKLVLDPMGRIIEKLNLL